MNPHLYLSDAERLVNSIFSEITTSLRAGKRVELRGFGVFSLHKRKTRVGRNPKTGQSVTVPAKAVPFFKAGKKLKERLNH